MPDIWIFIVGFLSFFRVPIGVDNFLNSVSRELSKSLFPGSDIPYSVDFSRISIPREPLDESVFFCREVMKDTKMVLGYALLDGFEYFFESSCFCLALDAS